MNSFDRVGYEIAFGYLSNAFENKKTELTKIARLYIEDVKEFFSNAIKMLDSIIKPKEKGSYSVPGLEKIFEVSNIKWKEASKEDIEHAMVKFSRGIDNLEEWSKNPKKFYEENPNAVKELSDLCRKLKELSAESYLVLD